MVTDAHTERAHAKLAPSSAHRWIACPGSIQMAEGIEENFSVFAAEGTAAHMLAERCLASGTDAAHFRDYTIKTAAGKGKTWLFAPRQEETPDGETSFLVDAEMVDGVQVYLDVCNNLAAESEEFEIEQRLDISSLVPRCYGTGDAIAYRSSPTRRVTIVDLKYGKGVAVEVEENEQELTYAAGVAQRYHNRGIDEVELVIVQPRASHRDGPVRRWATDVVGLYEHVFALQHAALAVDQPNAPLVAGAHCKFCKAAAVCPALRDAALAVIDARTSNGKIIGMSDPRIVPFADWKVEQGNINLVKQWAKSREEYAHAESVRGRPPQGSKLVDKRATRKWDDETVAVETLRMFDLPDDVIYETTLRSPAQLEKELPVKDRKIIGDLATAKSNGTVIAPIDDPRPAVTLADARGFKSVQIEERAE